MTTDTDYAAYLRWWENEGSGMPPLAKEDAEEHVRRVTQAAWMSAVHCARAVLAQPEPEFTAEEVEMIQAPWSYLAPAQPEPVGPSDEELLALAVKQLIVASDGTNPWQEDADISDEVVEYARAVLQRWGRPAIEPVPVSELPGEGDCDPSSPECTHWLPHNALPLPATPENADG